MEAYGHKVEIVICLNDLGIQSFFLAQIDHLEHLLQLQLSLIKQLLQQN